MYKVRVVRLMDYGAFVELPNGFQALLHISELAHYKVSRHHVSNAPFHQFHAILSYGKGLFATWRRSALVHVLSDSPYNGVSVAVHGIQTLLVHHSA